MSFERAELDWLLSIWETEPLPWREPVLLQWLRYVEGCLLRGVRYWVPARCCAQVRASAHAGDRPGRRALVDVSGCGEKVARRLLGASELWADPYRAEAEEPQESPADARARAVEERAARAEARLAELEEQARSRVPYTSVPGSVQVGPGSAPENIDGDVQGGPGSVPGSVHVGPGSVPIARSLHARPPSTEPPPELEGVSRAREHGEGVRTTDGRDVPLDHLALGIPPALARRLVELSFIPTPARLLVLTVDELRLAPGMGRQRAERIAEIAAEAGFPLGCVGVAEDTAPRSGGGPAPPWRKPTTTDTRSASLAALDAALANLGAR